MKIADVTAKPAYWGKNSSIYGQMAYVSCESEPFPQVNIDNPQVSQFQQGVSERVAGQQSSTYNDELEQVRATVKVVPLARPYISFGPASSQLLRENSDVTLYVFNLLALKKLLPGLAVDHKFGDTRPADVLTA